MSASKVQVLRRHKGAAIGAALLSAMAVAAIAAPVLAPLDPQLIAPFDRLQDPDGRYWFGTDQIGRDVFSRTVYGARVSMMVGCVVALVSIATGLVLGLLAGFIRWVDSILMRVMDGLMAIPSILLAIALVAISGPSIRSIVIAITIAEVPRVTRLVRGQVIALRGQLFIEAATTAGTSVPVILYRHIVPNLLAPLLVQASYVFAAAVMTEAVLSFIGAGVPPETPSWGNIIAEGRTVFQLAPHIVLFPSLVLSVMVLSVNILGDGLRDAFDPRFTGQK